MKAVFRSKKAILIISAMVIIVVAAGVTMANQGVAVKSTAVDHGTVEKIISETGTVESVTGVIVSSKSSGQIQNMHVAEGEFVSAGDLLLSYAKGSSAADINSLKAQISGLNAQYRQAKDLADKHKMLYDQGAMSYEEYNASVTEAAQLSSQIAALNYSIQSVSDATEAGGIASPISGTVTAVYAKTGEFALPGSPIFEISDMQNLHVEVNLISEDADKVAEGDSVRLYGSDRELIDDNATVGKVYLKAQQVLSELGISQKRVPVEIEPGTHGVLRLGSDVDVEIIIEKKDNTLRVPENAVFELNREKHVYLIKSGKAKLQRIKVGIEGEDFIEVLDGLKASDEVILSPGNDITDGVKIKTE